MARMTREAKIAAHYTREFCKLLLASVEQEIQAYARLYPAIQAAQLPDLLPWLEATRLLLREGQPAEIVAVLRGKSAVVERVVKCGGLFDRKGDWLAL